MPPRLSPIVRPKESSDKRWDALIDQLQVLHDQLAAEHTRQIGELLSELGRQAVSPGAASGGEATPSSNVIPSGFDVALPETSGTAVGSNTSIETNGNAHSDGAVPAPPPPPPLDNSTQPKDEDIKSAVSGETPTENAADTMSEVKSDGAPNNEGVRRQGSAHLRAQSNMRAMKAARLNLCGCGIDGCAKGCPAVQQGPTRHCPGTNSMGTSSMVSFSVDSGNEDAVSPCDSGGEEKPRVSQDLLHPDYLGTASGNATAAQRDSKLAVLGKNTAPRGSLETPFPKAADRMPRGSLVPSLALDSAWASVSVQDPLASGQHKLLHGAALELEGALDGEDYESKDPNHRKITLALKRAWADLSVLPEPSRRDTIHNMSAHDKPPPLLTKKTRKQSFIQTASWRYQGLIAHPSSKWRSIWDMMGMVSLGYDLVMIPLQAYQTYVKADAGGFLVLAYITSVYWTVDMFASFLVGYHSKGFVEMNPKRIALNYARSWFLLDVTLVTVDWSFILLGLSQQASFMRVGKTMSRGMRVLRLLRIVKMHTVVSGLMDRIRSEYVRTMFSIFGLVFFIIIINHFISCGFYYLAVLTGLPNNWVTTYMSQPEHNDFAYRYATALHWSLTQFTPASMEIFPQNAYERFYSVTVLLFALITFSSFVSSITQAMTHLRKINADKLKQQNVLRRYLNQHGISGKLVNRVWHYLHQREVIDSGKVRTKEHDVPILAMLPKSMRIELRFESFAPQLRKHPFFEHYGLTNEPALRHICHSAVVEISLLARQEIFSDAKGEEVQMLFVMAGMLEYHLPCACANFDDNDGESSGEDDRDIKVFEKRSSSSPQPEPDQFTHAGRKVMRVDRIHQGEWACEAALWAQKIELSSPFVATDKSEVVIVNTSEFSNIIMQHEHSRWRVAKYAANFTEYVGDMTNCRWRTVLCNDYSTIEDLVHRAFDYNIKIARQTEAVRKGTQHHRQTRRTQRGSGLPGLGIFSSGAAVQPGDEDARGSRGRGTGRGSVMADRSSTMSAP